MLAITIRGVCPKYGEVTNMHSKYRLAVCCLLLCSCDAPPEFPVQVEQDRRACLNSEGVDAVRACTQLMHSTGKLKH